MNNFNPSGQGKKGGQLQKQANQQKMIVMYC
jgi:hypothetical protein